MSPETQSLPSDLDNLLTKYLTLLDEHQTLRAQAETSFRKAFFSLAEANFRSPRGTRYGQDLYDDKMRATLRLSYQQSTGLGTNGEAGAAGSHVPRLEARRLLTTAKPKSSSSTTSDGTTPSRSEQSSKEPNKSRSHTELAESEAASEDPFPTPPASRGSTPGGPAAKMTDNTERKKTQTGREPSGNAKSAERVAKEGVLRDPIRQFGILVPPALRAAQGAFAGAAEDMIKAAGWDRQLQGLEIEIRRTRKRLARAKEEGREGSQTGHQQAA